MRFVLLSLAGNTLLLVAVSCLVMVLLHAFGRSAGTGFLVLLIPPVWVIYGFSQFEHRRKGLGRWVKGDSLRRLQQDRPDVTQVTTLNAEQNRPMRGLNEALGFRPVAAWTSCVLET